jgi:hypothetical protein
LNGSIASNERNLRERLAELLEEAQSSRRRHDSGDGHVHLSWADYEAFLAYRKAVAATTARIVQMATNA